jgi:DNA-binding response OmpR family regulator
MGTLQCPSDAKAEVSLDATGTRLLECLMHDSAIVIGRERLLQPVWGDAAEGGGRARVDNHMICSRRKLDVDATQPVYLHAVRRLDYILRPAAARTVTYLRRLPCSDARSHGGTS